MTLLTALGAMLLVFNFAVWATLRRRPDVSPLLSLALLSYLVLWNAYPFAYGTLLLDWTESLAQRDVYERLAVVHFACLLATLTLFLWLPGRVSGSVRDLLGPARTPPSATIAALAIGGLLYVVGVQRTLSLRGASYAEAASFLMVSSAGEAGRIALLDTVTYFVLCLAMAAIVASWPRHGRTIALLGWGIVAVAVLSALLQAMRAIILLPGTLLVAVNWQRARDRLPTHWRALALVMGATVLAAPLLAIVVGIVRLGGTGRLDVGTVRQGYDAVVSNLTLKERALLAAKDLNTKFDALSYGAILLQNDGIGTGGWRPYTSSLLSPIPRVLLRDKPVPTSKNGQNSGMPYRVAAEPFGAVEMGMVVPVTPVGVTLWELGYLGIPVVIAMNLIAFILANSLLAAGSIFGRALGVAMLSLPTTEFLFAPGSSLVRDLLRTLLYLAILWVATQGVLAIRRLLPGAPIGQRVGVG